MIYEVNITVSDDLVPKYRPWLQGHVERMLQIPAFIKAQILTVSDPKPTAGQTTYCVQYETKSQADLERYLATDAPKMRSEADAHFKGQYSIQRRILENLK